MSSIDAHSTSADDEHDGDHFVQVDPSAPGETWSIDAPETGDGAASASTSAPAAPHVSLFSPGVPAVVPSPSPSSSSQGHADAAIDHASTVSAPPAASRPLPALASLPKRAARLKVSDQHAPIVQLHAQIPRAQKSGDDPSTPLDTKSRKRTTHDLIGHEHLALTTLSRLFGETTAMSSSRAPSYNHATGPLHLRGTFRLCQGLLQ